MEQKALVDRVLALTLEIERAAAMADWPEAARLTEQRSPLLLTIGGTRDPAMLESIRRIQAIDASVFENAGVARSELQTEYVAAMQGARSVSAYHHVARLAS